MKSTEQARNMNHLQNYVSQSTFHRNQISATFQPLPLPLDREDPSRMYENQCGVSVQGVHYIICHIPNKGCAFKLCMLHIQRKQCKNPSYIKVILVHIFVFIQCTSCHRNPEDLHF